MAQSTTQPTVTATFDPSRFNRARAQASDYVLTPVPGYPDLWDVRKHTAASPYRVDMKTGNCACPDSAWNGVLCKHFHMVNGEMLRFAPLPGFAPSNLWEPARYLVAPVEREEGTYDVMHQDGGRMYRVDLVTGWCSCADHGGRPRPCQHLQIVLWNLVFDGEALLMSRHPRVVPTEKDASLRFVWEAGVLLHNPPAILSDESWLWAREKRLRRAFGDF